MSSLFPNISPVGLSPKMVGYKTKGWGYNSVIECLPNMYKTLGLIPQYHLKGRVWRERERERKEERERERR
jgi:hypothetical protein